MPIGPGTVSETQENRTLASFYTPREVAQILTDWAITDPDTTVLDPSFGGCAFLYSALETLRRKGNPAPGEQIYGVDIDPYAQSCLEPLLLAGATPEQFVTADLFDIAPNHFGDRLFGAVIGNPPYIRYHDIPDEAKKRAVARLRGFDIQISGRASYWAFFLLYSMQFLLRGGRLAMVLPGAFLHTDYSTQVRELLTESFEQITIYLLQERIFHGTDEETILICAAGARSPHRTLRIGAVRSVKELGQAFEDIQGSTRMLSNPQGDGGWLRALIQPEVLALYDQLLETPNVIQMGEWVRIHIGVVTGKNEYFVLSRMEQEQRSIPDDYLVPIIRRATHLTGLWVRDEDLLDLAENESKFLLFTPNHVESKLPPAVQRYIRFGEETDVSKARKCRERQPWYVVPHTFVPPAFMPCMSAAWPRLIVNQSRYTCTNNILRVLWKSERPAIDWLRLAIGTVSTLSQLSAELVGRSYGGGVLKLEPNELARLAVPLVPVEIAKRLAYRVDYLLRENRRSEATETVDAALLACNTGLTSTDMERLRAARDVLFLRRRQHRPDAQRILSS